MTRKKKTKSVASPNALPGVAPTSPLITTKATAAIDSPGNTRTPRNRQFVPVRNTMQVSTTPQPAAPSHISRSSTSSSVIDEVASTGSLNNASTIPQRKKKPVNVKVTYVTEQVHVYPKYPVLTVERLPNLDYHINTLKESIGRRPRVYQHGKGVRFISESNEEYRTIQRYLGKIQSTEKIAWCSYTVPTGSSLKVNQTVRKVEVLQVTNDIQKLSLENGTKPSVAKQNETIQEDLKLSAKDSSIQNVKPTISGKPEEVQLSTNDCSHQKVNLTPNDSLPKDAKLPSEDSSAITSNSSSTTSKTGLRQSTATNASLANKKKKPRDIAQNRSYKKTSMY